jgi:serine/threonine protein kinase/uncharacterized caspase-like protein
VIGVGEYLRAQQVETLRFASHDADALAIALADPNLCAFPPDQVLLLTDGDAGRDAIVQRLSRWLPERARGTELVVIYFAGHGMVKTVGRREEGFLLPYDADPDDVVTRGVAMSDVARWIDGLDTRAVVVCLDCCHAGKVLGQRGAAPPGRNMELRPAVLQGMSGRGRYLIASCDEGQKSYECAELGHGLFTFHLLKGIAGAADRDGDGRVGLTELFNYVATAVSDDARKRFGCEQKPWTSATWAEETYISSPNLRPSVADIDPLERIWRDQGTVAAVQEVERTAAQADEESLKRSLRFLGRVKEPTSIPVIFRFLGHASEAVRGEARSALHAFRWETVVGTVEDLARCGDPVAVAAVLDGLNAFEAHPRVVGLLDRVVVLLKGELRNRAILLLERKRLGLELDRVAGLFREIHSPYQIQKVLGQGLFTESYLARDEGTGLEVVVRVLRQEFANQPHVRAAFLDLSNRSVHLVHENLALTREARAFPDQQIYFAVRDYIPGVTLQRVLEAGKRFEPGAVGRILWEVAQALTPLHRREICHGGIKPSNIFLCEEDRVILGDPSLPVGGIGVALDRLAYDYRYVAPEMFRGRPQPAGPSSDFYALGCVAYELLCGAPPFVSDNFHELAARHINDRIIPPSQLGSKIGEVGDEIILKLLARSPEDRYGTLIAVLRTFARFEDFALRQPDTEALHHRHMIPPAPSPPLLHDASLANYQGGQSVLDFDQTGASLSELDRAMSQPMSQDLKVSRLSGMGSRLQVPGYEILEQLGHGGMGMVFKARDIRLDRVVALKVLRERVELGDPPEQQHRFRQEGTAIARLQHPNIVQIFGLIEHQGLASLALEYVGGGDLARKMRERWGQEEQMATHEAAEMMATLARAVHYAHERGVLHRDLKPSNVLLTSEGQPKIADFGLAKIQDRLGDRLHETSIGAVLGTPIYMAPEQAEGKNEKIGPATDMYALGTILYEMLTGQPPFRGATALETLQQVRSQKPAPPSQLRPEIPLGLELVCLKCLEKEPMRRYSTAAALADDLDRWLQGEPITASPPSLWRRLGRFFSLRKPDTPRREGRAPNA